MTPDTFPANLERMYTQRETVRILCKSILNRLENQKSITFAPRLRQVIQDELYQLVGSQILTDEDVKERAIAKIGASAEALQDAGFSESDQFKTAKTMIKQSIGDDALNGFYFQKPLRSLADQMVAYFMRSSHIDDVFETDEVLERAIVEIVQKFDLKQVH